MGKCRWGSGVRDPGWKVRALGQEIGSVVEKFGRRGWKPDRQRYGGRAGGRTGYTGSEAHQPEGPQLDFSTSHAESCLGSP